MIVIPNAAEAVMLNILLNKDAAEELDMHIYQNDVTPTAATVIGDFTEATFTGYASVELSSSNYAVAAGAGAADPATASYPAVNFTSSSDQSSQNCYGYYITRRTTGDLLWCERFTDGPYNIQNNGDGFSITQNLQMNTA